MLHRPIARSSIAALALTLVVVDACGRSPHPLRDEAAPYIDISPIYAPDGSRIAFASTRFDGTQIYLMDADGSNVRRLTFEGDYNGDPSWSPGGSRIAFCSDRAGSSDIWVMDADGSNAVNLTEHPADDCEMPAWSPDGETILFYSDREDGNFEIYAMAADGSGIRRLTHNPGLDMVSAQAFSPDGKKILFYSNMDESFDSDSPTRYDNFDLYLMDADGSNTVRLTTAQGEDSYAYWSPTGEEICYARYEGGKTWDLYRIRPDGTGIRRLTARPGQDSNASWHPSGRKLIFNSNRTGSMRIFEMRRDGTGLVQLTAD